MRLRRANCLCQELEARSGLNKQCAHEQLREPQVAITCCPRDATRDHLLDGAASGSSRTRCSPSFAHETSTDAGRKGSRRRAPSATPPLGVTAPFGRTTYTFCKFGDIPFCTPEYLVRYSAVRLITSQEVWRVRVPRNYGPKVSPILEVDAYRLVYR